MRRHIQILTAIAALTAPYGMAEAQTLDAARIAKINTATESFLALAKDFTYNRQASALFRSGRQAVARYCA